MDEPVLVPCGQPAEDLRPEGGFLRTVLVTWCQLPLPGLQRVVHVEGLLPPQFLSG